MSQGSILPDQGKRQNETQMKDFSPEILTAYVDGELDDNLRREVDEAIRHDRTVRATVERLRSSRIMLGEAFAGMLDAPVPERLLQTLVPPKPDPGSAEVIPLRKPAKAQPEWMPMALAASVSLTIGLVVGFIAADTRQSASSETTASMLQEVLATLPTGDSRNSLDGQTIFTLLSSFRAQDGRICREFEQQANALRSVGIACKDSTTTDWKTQVQFTASRALTDEQGGALYSPASGEVDPLGWALDRLGAGPVFDAEEEARLIRDQWRD